MQKTLLFLLLMIFSFSHSQIVINELDCDTPSIDDKEFIELKSELPYFSLDGYVLVFFNGSGAGGNRSYYTIDLTGLTTDRNGLVVVGNTAVSPVPQRLFPTSIIQNGADAIAIYQAAYDDFPDETLATTQHLIDVLLYDTSDPDDAGLMNIFGVTTQINENEHNMSTLHSIQRKMDGTFEVKIPTPGTHNDGSGFTFNGVSYTVSTPLLEEGGDFTISFTTQFPVQTPLTFDFTLDNGTFDIADYTGSTTVTIPAGGTTYSTTIHTIDDGLDEGDEVALIRILSLPEEFIRLNDNYEVRIVDNDYTVSSWGTPLNPTYGIVSSTQDPDYYASLEGLSGAALKQAVQDIIANPAVVRAHSYGDVTSILYEADQNPLNSNEVWLMYTEQGRAKYKFQLTSNSVGFWNREHIFPQSRGGFSNGTSPLADGIAIYLPTNADDILSGHADAHALRSEDGPENSTRSNRDYGLNDYNGPVGNQGSWHGDVARALFYMAVRYTVLDVVNGNLPDTTPSKIGDLATLLEWNHADPADDFEMNRNNIIYTWQQNRNPFIDYPDLADYIWGTKNTIPWFATLSNEDISKNSWGLYPNPAKNHFKITGLTGAYTVAIYSVSGQKLGEHHCYGESEIQPELPSGLYIAKINAADGIMTQKILIQ